MPEREDKRPSQIETEVERPVEAQQKRETAGESVEEKVLSINVEDQLPKKDELIGKVIAGRYEVISKIGAGGMGAVYKAKQIGMDRFVAIKVMLKSFAKEPTIVKRFKVEALAVSRLNHPNTVRIYDFGQMESGDLFIAMEYLEGRPLEQVLKKEGALPVMQALHIIKQVASSLAEAHAKGIIHRDLKPENIFLVSVGNDPYFVKVLDFGVAKLKEADKRFGTLTQTGAVFGTPKYMAPEQCRGKEVDGRTDIYAMGVILYEMLTGQAPFTGDSPIAIMLQHVQEDPKPPTLVKPELDIPKEVEEIVLKCMRKDPAERYQSAGELLAAIGAVEGSLEKRYVHVVYVDPSVREARRKLAATEAPTVYDTGHMEEPRVSGGSKRGWIAGVILALIAGGGATWYFVSSASSQREDSQVIKKATPPQSSKAPEGAAPKKAPKVIKTFAIPVEERPKNVTLTIHTSPEGAQVYIDGKKVGVTPFKGEFPRSMKPVRVLLKKKGYKDREKILTLNEDAVVELVLKRKYVKRKAPATAKKKEVKKPKSTGPAKVKDLKEIF